MLTDVQAPFLGTPLVPLKHRRKPLRQTLSRATRNASEPRGCVSAERLAIDLCRHAAGTRAGVWPLGGKKASGSRGNGAPGIQTEDDEDEANHAIPPLGSERKHPGKKV